jgi:hypothetical protein
MKCKHGREPYYENRICRECMAEREQELLDALYKVRMMIKQEIDRTSVVKFINDVLDDQP